MARRALTIAFLLLARTAHADDDVQDVVVTGSKGTKSGQTSIGGAEVRQVPGAFGDAFRAIETLPGVTPTISGVPFFFVRGAPPGNNGTYLDGIKVPLLYHVGLGPSVIHPGLIQKVDFWPGGYPAQYGRYTGGMLAGTTRAPAEELHGEGNIRLFDAGALVETPFDHGCGSALIAGRYSYTGAIVSLAAPRATLDYWDYQARVAYAVTEHDTASVFAFGSYDFLGQKNADGSEDSSFGSQFHRVDFRWDRKLPNGGKLRVATTIGIDSTETDEIKGVRDRSLSSRLYVEQPVSSNVLVRGGVDANIDHYDLDQSSRSIDALYPPRNDLVLGAHLDAVMRVTPEWEVTPGVRVDEFESVRRFENATRFERRRNANDAKVSADPRLLSRIKIGSKLTFVSTFAMTHQTPAFFIPVPGLQIGRLAQGLQTGVQTSEGFEIQLPAAVTVTPTLFHHEYLNLTDYATTCIGDSSNDSVNSDCIDQRVRGRSYGFEILVKRSLTQKLSGWLSYTLSRTTRTAAVSRLFDRKHAFTEIPGDFDRTHVLNVIGAYDLGKNWRLGARFYFYTGRPYSDRIKDNPIPPYNDKRTPDFWRIDGRLEKTWLLGGSRQVSFVLEVLNMALQKEVTGVSCEPNPGLVQDTCKFDEIGPITIPSIGVEGRF